MALFPRSYKSLEAEFTLPKATFIIALFTVISRLAGLIRTRLFTSTFGASETLDIYFAAFRIPDFLMNILILGTLSVAFLPVLTGLIVRDKERAYALARSIFTIALLGMTIVCVITLLFLPMLTRSLVPGFSPDQVARTVELTQLILVAQIVFAISTLFTTLLNAHKHFLIAAFAPILYNAGIILGIVFFYPQFGLLGLGYGVILGSVFHLLVQLPEAFRLGFVWWPTFKFRDPGVKKVFALYIPRLFFIDLSQVSLLIASVLGSLLAAGSISVFNLAFDLQAVPTGIFAISTAIAAFPIFSESFAANNKKLFWDTLVRSSIQILFFIVPISIAILIFRAYIVRILYGGGEFNWDDTRATFQVLGIFTFSLFSQALVPLFSRALYARHNTKIPVLIGLVAVVINVGISYLLAPHFGIKGVAYGFTVASIVNALVLYIVLRVMLSRDVGQEHALAHGFDLRIAQSFVKIVFASIVLGVVCFAALRLVAPFVNTRTGLGITIQSGIAASLGALSFVLAGLALKLEEASSLTRRLVRLLPGRR